ncbi:BBE domain-containing protein [Kribbella sp. NPDC050470]|uniref:BBE domain-containing protein n=1 Tax=unclassified Kribbella TaxID=2644121 RepID=UPI0037B6C57B
MLGISTTGNAAAAAAQLESFVGSKASTRSITVKTHMEAVRYLGAWRSALGVIQWYSSAQGRTAQTFITNCHRAVRKYSAGGYVNYVENGRSVSTYYGAGLARLRTVKKKYDPSNFFRTPYTLV